MSRAGIVRSYRIEAAARKVTKEFDLWAQDANDGEFALWSRERLCAAIVELRMVLDGVGIPEAVEK